MTLLNDARVAAVLAIPLVCVLITHAQAQIRTDGTLGGPAVALSGPNFLINESLGRLVGSNLFHSFQVFNVGNAQSATFVTTTAGLANVVSRVTGGTASQINGLLRLDSANAAPNFFFINPAGVTFGGGASIDVPAAFHVGTANYLKFPDGNFYADPKMVSTLSAAAPEAFGFLGTTRAPIAVRDGATVASSGPISLSAGDLEVNNATIQTAGADIRAIAVGPSAMEVPLSGSLPQAFGDLALVNGGYLLTIVPRGAHDAGNIAVSAGSIVIDGGGRGDRPTGIQSANITGEAGNSGRIDVAATGALLIADAGQISSTTHSTGLSGSIAVTATDITIDARGGTNFTGVAIAALGGSSNGDVDVSARGTLSIVNRGQIVSDASANAGCGP